MGGNAHYYSNFSIDILLQVNFKKLSGREVLSSEIAWSCLAKLERYRLETVHIVAKLLIRIWLERKNCMLFNYYKSRSKIRKPSKFNLLGD